MAAPTGLYGHIQANRRRSLLLFAMFAVAFQLLAAVTLFLPLLLIDPAHAPVYATGGYIRRYVPALFALLFILFAAQMWWFVGAVRRRTRFRYVDSVEEPRFCRILEPLAIAAGIPTPYAGVIETAGMTAFACGVRDRHVVVVATRGLIDGLDDEELAAVLANAVIHIRNRDTRLLAAATIFMRNMAALQRERGLKFDHPLQVLPLVVFPFLLPVILLIGFWIQIAFRIAYGSRALIGISRELIADAEAVRLTHNPAAFASALRKIEASNAVRDFTDEHAAMLVVGVTHGPLATHPTVEERIGALARTTGSMVLDGGPRRDTRAPALRRAAAFGRSSREALERVALLAEAPAQRGFVGAFRSVGDPERNILGMTRRGMLLLALSIAGIALVYRETLSQPGAVRNVFALSQLREFRGVGAIAWRCTFALTAGPAVQEQCEKAAGEGVRLLDHLPAFAGKDGGSLALPTFRETEQSRLAEWIAAGCYSGRWDGVAASGRDSPTPFSAYLEFAATGAPELAALPAGPQRDEALVEYAELRLLLVDNASHFFGEEGLKRFYDALHGEPHRLAVAALAQRLADPAFAGGLPTNDRADFTLLARQPLTLKPCWLKRTSQGSGNV
jgi:Zn-dependent protease with chaperone function